MSKKLHSLVSAMLVFSLMTSTALAQTDVPPELPIQAVTDSVNSVLSDESTESADNQALDITDTQDIPYDDSVDTGSLEDTTTKKETTEQKPPEISLEGLPKSSSNEYPKSLFDLEQKFYSEKDVDVDKATKPYKDGIHLELRYVNHDSGLYHIPTFKVALIDENGKGLGVVEANRANYNKELRAYQLVIPHNKALNYGDKVGIYVYNFDGSIDNVTLKRELPLLEKEVEDDVEVTFVEETVPLKNQQYFFYRLGYSLVENEGKVEKHYMFSAVDPLMGWVETKENVIAFNFVTAEGTPLKNTKFTLREPNKKGNKIEVQTDQYGVAYVSANSFKGKVVYVESEQYELAGGIKTIGVDIDKSKDRTTVKKVEMQLKPKEDKDKTAQGAVLLTSKIKGDNTLTSEWLDATVVFKSKDNKDIQFNIGPNDIKNGLLVSLPQGKYTVTAEAPYANIQISQKEITVGDKQQTLNVEVSPKYILEVSKDGNPFNFKFLNMISLTGKEFSGTKALQFGVVPNQSFMVEDLADGKIYTVFINPDYTVTKLVLGVGTVWGGDVTTPHTGDSIIFLVALFLISLIIAGIGFYFHRTGKRVKHVAMTTGLITLLVLSSLPVNVVQASLKEIKVDGTSSGTGASGSYGYTASGTIQVDANASLLMTTIVPLGEKFSYKEFTKDKINGELGDYLFDPQHLATSLFWATNQTQYNQAKTGSFMVYDYERSSLIPIWGNQNAVLGTVNDNILKSNRQALGILNNSFRSRLVAYPYQPNNTSESTVANTDIDGFFRGILASLGGNNSTRQLWTGKDILGIASSSQYNIGDVLTIDKTDNFIDDRYKVYFPKYNRTEGKPVDVLLEAYLASLGDLTSITKIERIKEDSYGKKTAMDEIFENLDLVFGVNYKKDMYINFILMYQNVHGVYIKGQSKTHMAYMSVVDLGEWFHDAMQKSTNYKKLNILPYETGKMVYHPNVTNGAGKGEQTRYPTHTFRPNVENTTAKALVPKSSTLPARSSNGLTELNKNPFSGWGYTLYSSDGYNLDYKCASCTGKGTANPGIHSWLKLHITKEDGSTETKTVPWNVIPSGEGEEEFSNFLGFLRDSDLNSSYYEFDGSYVHEGKLYVLQNNEANSKARLTLVDRETKKSLLRPFTGSSLPDDKHNSLFDGFYYLHKNQSAIEYNTVDTTSYPIVLDNVYLPSLSSIKAYLSPDPEFEQKVNEVISKNSTELVHPIPNSGYTYPSKPYNPLTSFVLGEHFSQADLTLEIWVDEVDLAKKLEKLDPKEAQGTHTVPEWRLSKYASDATLGTRSDSIVTFRTPGSTWKSPKVTHQGDTKFNLSVSDLSGVPWLESRPKMFNGDTEWRYVSPYGNNFVFHVGGDLLAIKDNSTVTNTKLASWKNNVSILSKKIGVTSQGEIEPNGKSSVVKTHTVKYFVRSPYSDYTYSELRRKCGKYSCWWYRWYGKANMNYEFDSTNHITVVFKRYNPKEGVKPNEFAKTIDKNTNGFYWESYQDTQTIKINPEVSMVYDDRNGNPTVVQTAADRLREIKPVHYNSIRFKDVTITPKVDGMSVATDTKAKQLANKLGANGLDVIYKGASTSVSYEITGDIELRTYALDIGSKALKNTWGNSSYSTEKVRDEFLTRHATKNADGTWTIRPTVKGNFVINGRDYSGVSENKNITQKDYKVIEHTLVIRGGQLHSVNGQTDLNKLDPMLKDALQRMNISTERGKNVFNQFEFSKGANLTEANVANLINKIRGTNELAVGKPWYYEDATTLVVREYITTFKLTPHVYVDKLPQEVPGIQTPLDKSQFFNQGYKGHTKLRYQLVDSWLEYDTSKAPYTPPYATKPYGPQSTQFVVPNVSITDTAQF